MKKFFLLLAVLVCGYMPSCSNGDGGEESQNPLVGTIWERSYTASLTNEIIYDYIEFVNGTAVTVWSTEWSGGSYSGTYTVMGNTVTFKNLTYKNLAGSKDFLRATFTSNALTVYWKYPDSSKESKTVYTKK